VKDASLVSKPLLPGAQRPAAGSSGGSSNKQRSVNYHVSAVAPTRGARKSRSLGMSAAAQAQQCAWHADTCGHPALLWGPAVPCAGPHLKFSAVLGTTSAALPGKENEKHQGHWLQRSRLGWTEGRVASGARGASRGGSARAVPSSGTCLTSVEPKNDAPSWLPPNGDVKINLLGHCRRLLSGMRPAGRPHAQAGWSGWVVTE